LGTSLLPVAGRKRAIMGKKEFAASGVGDRMEKETMEFHLRVRKGYLELAEQEPERITTTVVSGSIQDIHNILVSLIEPFFAKAQ